MHRQTDDNLQDLSVFLAKGIGPGPAKSVQELVPELPKRRAQHRPRLWSGLTAAAVLLAFLLSLNSVTLAHALASIPGIGKGYYNLVNMMGLSYELGFMNELNYVVESQGARITVNACVTDKEKTTVLFSIERLDGQYLEIEHSAFRIFVRRPGWVERWWSQKGGGGGSTPGPNGGRSHLITAGPMPWFFTGKITIDIFSTDPRLPGRWTMEVPVQRLPNYTVETVALNKPLTENQMTVDELQLTPTHTTLLFNSPRWPNSTRWTMKTTSGSTTVEGNYRMVMFPRPMGQTATFTLESAIYSVLSGEIPLLSGAVSEGALRLTVLSVESDDVSTQVHYELNTSAENVMFWIAELNVRETGRPPVIVRPRVTNEAGVLDFPVDIRGKDVTLFVAYEQEVYHGISFEVSR